MLFRCITISGRHMEFTLGDCPINLGSNRGALSGLPGSPLFHLDTITRGFELSNGKKVFEGDLAYDSASDELVGYVVYNKGFFIQTQRGLQIEIDTASHIYMRDGDINSIDKVVYEMQRTPLIFKCDSKQFFLDHFVCKKKGVICLYAHSKAVTEEDIKNYTGVDIDGYNKVFYGDFVSGGLVVMHKGIPYIKNLANGGLSPLENILQECV